MELKKWDTYVKNEQDEIIKDTQQFLQIESVLDETTAKGLAPFGDGIREAYDWLLHKARTDGFQVKEYDGYAAHIEWGSGEEVVGILCHIDVVPGGDDWTSPAFSAQIRDEKIYARGAIDDKGPTMACYYAMKILKDSGVSLGKRIRLIVGTDEESQWRCVDHYFKHETMPTFGFAPDADFPIIYAEKGICDFHYTKKLSNKNGFIQSFQSGQRLNMVPDRANAFLHNIEAHEEELKKSFEQFLLKKDCKGSAETLNGLLKLTVHGVSAHGMEPNDGVNAGLLLATFLLDLSLNEDELAFFQPLVNFFLGDSRGEKLGFSYSNEELGNVTVNLGKMNYELGSHATIGLNVRYPKDAAFEEIKVNLDTGMGQYGFTGEIGSHGEPHMVDKKHPLVRTLSNVYKESTGEEAKLLAIGGGTYARSLDAGVAFGPLFPGQKDLAHQADEHIAIDHLLMITTIYTKAIYELAK
ncbi:dipeptidase PepV [Salipaludibacillus daqingensis]|uniref:dipeptidase PepV n=1 Tax=Salipaludibacillus daqingensis TaxID=3041001 RepID=UPI003CC879CE